MWVHIWWMGINVWVYVPHIVRKLIAADIDNDIRLTPLHPPITSFVHSSPGFYLHNGNSSISNNINYFTT